MFKFATVRIIVDCPREDHGVGLDPWVCPCTDVVPGQRAETPDIPATAVRAG